MATSDPMSCTLVHPEPERRPMRRPGAPAPDNMIATGGALDLPASTFLRRYARAVLFTVPAALISVTMYPPPQACSPLWTSRKTRDAN